MNDTKDWEVIDTYSQKQAIEDGMLVKICDIRWGGITKPYIATSHIYDDIGVGGAMAIWPEFADWRTRIMPTLPEEEQIFSTIYNERKVWVVEDGSGFTLMYPEDY
jgi:hypothetical protein